MIKVLITGINSFTGNALKNYLAKWPEKYSVKTISLRGSAWENENFGSFDTIFHAAGIAHDSTKKIPADAKNLYYEINSELAFNTALKAKNEGIKQFIFMSSSIVYGSSAEIGCEKIITRDTPVSPESFYGDSKVQAENKLKILDDNNFKICILRCPMIYGKNCKGNYITLSKFAKKLHIFPRIKNSRSMLYIQNMAEFVRLITDNQERGIFWPQNAEYSNTSELVRMIAEIHGKKIILLPFCEMPLKFLANFSGMVNKAFGNLVYDQNISEYKSDYRLYDLKRSITETEA